HRDFARLSRNGHVAAHHARAQKTRTECSSIAARVCGVVRRDLGKRHTAQLSGESRTQRDNFHRRALRSISVLGSKFPPESASRQEAGYAREISFDLPPDHRSIRSGLLVDLLRDRPKKNAFIYLALA